MRGKVAYAVPRATVGAGVVAAAPERVNSRDFSPNRDWKVEPATVMVARLPWILIELTRPPHAPAPSRLVTWIARTVPTPGQRLATWAAVTVLVQAWDRTAPS